MAVASSAYLSSAAKLGKTPLLCLLKLQIRRAFRGLATRDHPDKGGDPDRFRLIQQAYEVLSDSKKRNEYDITGKVIKTAEEEFVDAFGGGEKRRTRSLLWFVSCVSNLVRGV